MSIILGFLGVALLFELMIILGTMREVVILRGDVRALGQLITKPPSPSFLNGPLPGVLGSELRNFFSHQSIPQHMHVVLFLKSECAGCEELLFRLRETLIRHEISPDDISCVVLAASTSDPSYQAERAVSRHVILDYDGAILRACEVRGTPTQFAVRVRDLHVVDYTFGGDVAWIRQRLSKARALTGPSPAAVGF
jgi:hypothetical protein